MVGDQCMVAGGLGGRCMAVVVAAAAVVRAGPCTAAVADRCMVVVGVRCMAEVRCMVEDRCMAVSVGRCTGEREVGRMRTMSFSP